MTDTQLFKTMVPAFCRSLEDTFEQMVFLPVKTGEDQEKKGGWPTGMISGTLGVGGVIEPTGIELRAKVSLVFSEPLAKRIFRNMMMMEADAPVDMAELQDVVGELTNMTAGGAKTRLSEDGFRLQLSLPTVAVGQDHYLSAPSGVALSKVIPVEMDSDRFYMEVSVT